MKKILYTVVLLSLFVFLAACGGNTENGEEVYEIQLGHTGAPDHHYNTIAEEYSELVEERSDGNIKIDVFPADQLGDQLDSVEAVMSGTQDMVLTSETVLSNWEPEMGMLNLPYIFNDLDHVEEVLNGEVGDSLGEKMEDHGAVMIAWWAGGFRHITNSQGPIDSPNDLEGLKIRVPEGDVFVDTFKAMGASPTITSMSELYSALQLGTVDAQENPPAHILTQKFYEVQDYVSRTNHTYLGSPLIMNKEMLEDMPEDYQKILIDTGRELLETHIDIVEELEEEQWEEVEENGMEILDPDLEPFKKATKPVIEEYKEVFDSSLIEKIIESQ